MSCRCSRVRAAVRLTHWCGGHHTRLRRVLPHINFVKKVRKPSGAGSCAQKLPSELLLTRCGDQNEVTTVFMDTADIGANPGPEEKAAFEAVRHVLCEFSLSFCNVVRVLCAGR